jgi:hypothetical protein
MLTSLLALLAATASVTVGSAIAKQLAKRFDHAIYVCTEPNFTGSCGNWQVTIGECSMYSLQLMSGLYSLLSSVNSRRRVQRQYLIVQHEWEVVQFLFRGRVHSGWFGRLTVL